MFWVRVAAAGEVKSWRHRKALAATSSSWTILRQLTHWWWQQRALIRKLWSRRKLKFTCNPRRCTKVPYWFHVWLIDWLSLTWVTWKLNEDWMMFGWLTFAFILASVVFKEAYSITSCRTLCKGCEIRNSHRKKFRTNQIQVLKKVDDIDIEIAFFGLVMNVHSKTFVLQLNSSD